MFRGQFVHGIDAKGRVSVPARFRDALIAAAGGSSARFVITPAPFDPCLHVYPLAVWEEIERKIGELPSYDRNVVRFRRLFISAAVESETDKSGRVLIPPSLREKAALEKEVLWAGMGKNVELWSKQRWDAALEVTADEEESFRNAVEQFPI